MDNLLKLVALILAILITIVLLYSMSPRLFITDQRLTINHIPLNLLNNLIKFLISLLFALQFQILRFIFLFVLLFILFIFLFIYWFLFLVLLLILFLNFFLIVQNILILFWVFILLFYWNMRLHSLWWNVILLRNWQSLRIVQTTYSILSWVSNRLVVITLVLEF